MDEQELQQEEFDLEDILKEFAPEEEVAPEAPAEEEAEEAPAPSVVTGDTVRISIPQAPQMAMDMGDTIKFAPVVTEEEEQEEEAPAPELPEKAEPYTDGWEPDYDQPMGDYIPPKPIMFQPRSKLHALKKALVNGPERRYYELGEQGVGRLQIAILFSALVAFLCAGATALHALGMVPTERLKLMVFGQFFAMLLSALLGCYQLMEGVGDIFKGRFSLNSMLALTFAACCVDGVLCLQQQRIPCCAAFCLQVTMSLWSSYHRRHAEMGLMDTLRKATHLNSVEAVEDYYENGVGFIRGEGRLEDFMENYDRMPQPEKTLNLYALVAAAISAAVGIAAGVLHRDISFGIQVLAVTMLAAVPVTSFITVSRPAAILQRKLHKLGAVLCGWQGVETLSRRGVFALEHEDLFPFGACKLNGVKFYGSRDPDEVVAYCAGVICTDGGTLTPLFTHLLESRNGRHYEAEELRSYPGGGIGGVVNGEAVLIGSGEFLKEMGVEVPEGIRIEQAVYASIDGELSGVFAVTYAKSKAAAAGLTTLCAYRGLRAVLTTTDFMLTEDFIVSRFRVKGRALCFPERQDRAALERKAPGEDSVCAALVTADGLASHAYAVTGARSLRSAARLGLAVHMLGGIVGIAMMLILAIIGARELLTPGNVLLYELAWLIPGLLITEWTRSI